MKNNTKLISMSLVLCSVGLLAKANIKSRSPGIEQVKIKYTCIININVPINQQNSYCYHLAFRNALVQFTIKKRF